MSLLTCLIRAVFEKYGLWEKISYTRTHFIETSAKIPRRSFVVSCGTSRHNEILSFELFNTHVPTGTKGSVCESNVSMLKRKLSLRFKNTNTILKNVSQVLRVFLRFKVLMTFVKWIVMSWKVAMILNSLTCDKRRYLPL